MCVCVCVCVRVCVCVCLFVCMVSWPTTQALFAALQMQSSSSPMQDITSDKTRVLIKEGKVFLNSISKLYRVSGWDCIGEVGWTVSGEWVGLCRVSRWDCVG